MVAAAHRSLSLPQPSAFSVVAADVRTGEAGIAVQSKFLSVGAIVPRVRGCVGALPYFDGRGIIGARGAGTFHNRTLCFS